MHPNLSIEILLFLRNIYGQEKLCEKTYVSPPVVPFVR